MAKSATNSTGQFLWNGPSLLVPVDVEALVVSQLAQNYTWSNNITKYRNAGKFINVQPSMFDSSVKPKIGVTLHWALPDGITHGRQEENSTTIKYPFAPNRWLIIRYYDGKSRAWILQSDYIDPKDGSNEFLNPNIETPALTKIGKVWQAELWPGESGVTQQKFLIALGPGNPAFAAYTANIDNVFSFYDKMEDIVDKEVRVTYAVMGWYGDGNDDPLYNFSTFDEWSALMSELRWKVGDTGDENAIQKAVNDWIAFAAANGISIDINNPKDIYPSRTICQGMVYDVNWLGRNGKAQTGVPQYFKTTPLNEQPQIAIANTAVDALAALVEYELNLSGKDGAAAAEILEAFNYNLLYKYELPGGQFQLYREIFRNWFSGHDGEDYYYIEDKDKPTDPVISPERLAKLVELNQKSEKRNLRKHLLNASQQNLYGDWWKTGKAKDFWEPPLGITDAEWAAIQKRIKDAIPVEKEDIAALKAEIDALDIDIGNLIEEVKSGLAEKKQDLKKNTGNRYHQANDPVVLIYGAKRSYRHGEDGRFDDHGELLTRFTGQAISGLKVVLGTHGPQPVTSQNVTLRPVNLPMGKVPKETAGLCAETFFFDTINAEAIAKAACTLLGIPFDPAYAGMVRKQQTSAWNADVYRIDRQLVTDASGFIGTIPSKIAVQLWSPPWAPLYMAWEIMWYPSYDMPADALGKWVFNPETLEYDWAPGHLPASKGVTLRGYNLITPKSAYVMEAELEKYFDDTGNFPDLKNFLNSVTHWDFLTQTMGGFNELLLSLTPDQLNQPDADTSKYVGDMTQVSPIPEQSINFYPVRAGHFKLIKLWVVDDFGQVFDPMSAVSGSAANYKPVFGTGMVTLVDDKLAQLPPRVTQPARFNFNLVSGDGKDEQTRQQNQTIDPICGWLLPNHLDKALSLYTPDGHLLGELLLTGSSKTMKLRWDSAPGKNTPVGTPLDQVIENDYLRRFVEQLLQRQDNAKAFQDFLTIIDETLWTVEPLGGRRNELISVFIGRPLALVRSTMKYNLMDDLVYKQSWKDSALNVTQGYEQVKFPVQVGSIQDPQDGTIGYFFDDFITFNSILSENRPTISGYITNNPVSLNMVDEAKNVFIVVDPRGEVNTISGILPVQVNVLPGPLVEDAMANMNVTFRTGPLIADPDKFSMPLPSEISGSWSWIQHTGVTTWEEISKIAQANAKARLGTDYELKDGWLKLSNALIDDSQ